MVKKVLGVDFDKLPYVFCQKDPRKIPLSQCRSMGDLMATMQRCRELDEEDEKIRGGKVCQHKNTHNENWPDGGSIEVCDDCGMSCYHWEQGKSDWMEVDIEKARKNLQKLFTKFVVKEET